MKEEKFVEFWEIIPIDESPPKRKKRKKRRD